MTAQGWWLTLHIPKRIVDLVMDLQKAAIFPKDQTWWFAWNTLNIALPSLLQNATDLEREWDALRVFSSRAELRFGRRGQGWGCWLLLEEQPREVMRDLYSRVREAVEVHIVEADHHVLAGQKLRFAHEEKRGEIVYPRLLEYGVPDDNLSQALVVRVKAYYDSAYRLMTMRYAEIEGRTPGTLEPRQYPNPIEAIALARGDLQGGAQ